MAALSRLLLNETDHYIESQLAHIFGHRPDLAENAAFSSTVRDICRYNITAFARILAGSAPEEEAAAVRDAAFTSGEMMSKSGISLPELLEV
jgi:hypothetical protein